MENFFSKSLYVQGLKKLKTVGIGCAVTFAVINALSAISNLMQKNSYLLKVGITGGMLLPIGALIIPIAFLMISQAFSFLDKRKDSDFYHSLPQKRLCVYLSLLSSAMTWAVGILALSLCLNLLLWLQSPYSVDFSAILPVLLGFSASAFAVAGVSVVCRIITGTTSAFVFYTVCSFLFPRLFLYIFTNYLVDINPSIVIKGSFFDAFSFEYSPFFPLCTVLENDMDLFENGLFIAFLFLEAFVFFFIGARLFIRRKSELAGAKIISKKLQFLFRSLSITPILFFLFADFNDFDSAAIWFVFALLVHFLFDLILSRSVKTSVSNLPLFFLTLGISIVFLISANVISKVYISNNPKVNEIESIMFTEAKSTAYNRVDYYGWYERRNVLTDNEDAIKAAVNALDDTSLGDYRARYSDQIMFRLKNGKTVKRNIRFTEEEYLIIKAAIKSEDEYKQSFSFPEWSNKAYFTVLSGNLDYVDGDITDKSFYDTVKKEYLALSPKEQAEAEICNSSVYIFMYEDTYVFRLYLHEDMFPESLTYLKNASYN